MTKLENKKEEKVNRDKRAKAYKLAKAAGLINFWGKATDQYKSLIINVTGKDRMADMIPEEVDKFLAVLENLAPSKQNQHRSSQDDPWSSKWTWIVVFVLIIAILFVIDQFTGEVVVYTKNPFSTNPYKDMWTSYVSDGLTWSPIVTGVLLFNMISAALLRPYIKRHGRNNISWTTAIILFSPILAGFTYLLTWPSRDKD
ncbi:hypothetical protein ACFLXY_09330 [Chloroflexota bacterium]